MSANRQYKDSVFTRLFDEPDKLLSLYNAISGSELPSNTPVLIATLEDVLFMERLNDIAFVLDDRIVVMLEHMATIPENLPIRLLIYLARVYEKIIDNDAIYRKTLLKIPRSDFIVLYNGTTPYPDEKIIRLSDAFKELPEELTALGGSLELEVKVINVNEGRNETIVKKCKDLYGYTIFVGKVRRNEKAGMDLTAAVTKAVKDCIAEEILKEFLEEHGSEVVNMLTAEWNMDRALAVREKEGREEGREEGIDLSTKIILALKQNVPIEEIADRYNTTVEKVRAVQSALIAFSA